jgi:NADH:ubiquinone oxidoreductase subunit 5 (subunit L)/multisubunit Na+/H+ antiporter MnhA subunit
MSGPLQRHSCNSGGDIFFAGDGLSFVLRSPLLTVFKSFIPFGNFFTQKPRLSEAPKQRHKISNWWTLLPLGVRPLLSAIAAFAGGFLHMVTPTCPPHPLEAKLHPSYHLGSGRRPEKVHCTELSNTLYYRHISLSFSFNIFISTFLFALLLKVC